MHTEAEKGYTISGRAGITPQQLLFVRTPLNILITFELLEPMGSKIFISVVAVKIVLELNPTPFGKLKGKRYLDPNAMLLRSAYFV